MVPVFFSSEDITFQIENQLALADWFSSIVKDHGKEIGEISIILVSDEQLLEINRELLDHDYYTDIITLPMHVAGADELIAELYISIDRVTDNASSFGVTVVDELHRVMVHGILHLLGHDDKDESSTSAIRMMEDKCLEIRTWLSN